MKRLSSISDELWNIAGAFFNGFQWFRKLHGGKWEYWHVDYPVCSQIWHSVDEFARISGERPGLCRGTPIEEDWS